MSSDGEVWVSLTTCNTDSDVLSLFMTHLCSSLTKQRADWRDSTVFLLDGVSILLKLNRRWKSVGFLSQVRRESSVFLALTCSDRTKCTLQLRSCACRAFLRVFKEGRFESREHCIGKAVGQSCQLNWFSSFREIAKLVHCQVVRIPRSTIIACYRHCIEHLFSYLSYQPLWSARVASSPVMRLQSDLNKLYLF